MLHLCFKFRRQLEIQEIFLDIFVSKNFRFIHKTKPKISRMIALGRFLTIQFDSGNKKKTVEC